jgi:hypothetical protein
VRVRFGRALGFLAEEQQDDLAWRWTDGAATLAISPQPAEAELSFKLLPWLHYWDDIAPANIRQVA